MKQPKTLQLHESTVEELDQLRITRSSAIQRALIATGEKPERLVRALGHRLGRPVGVDNLIKFNVTLDVDIDETLEHLVGVSKLNVGQVVMLAVEAYVYKL